MSRELDKTIAQHIFHLPVITSGRNHNIYSVGEPDYFDKAGFMYLSNPVPNYSSDLNEAWKVVQSHTNVATAFSLRIRPDDTTETQFINHAKAQQHFGVSENPAEAICIVALNLVEAKAAYE